MDDFFLLTDVSDSYLKASSNLSELSNAENTDIET